MDCNSQTNPFVSAVSSVFEFGFVCGFRYVYECGGVRLNGESDLGVELGGIELRQI